MNKSYLIAFAVLVAAILWMLPALTGKNHKEADETTVAGKNAAAGTNVQAMRVDVLTVHAKKLAAHVVVNGQTQASRVVDLRARTDGKIAKLYFDRGARVQEGDVIAAMEVEDRQALLERARALLQQRKREHEVAAGLKKQGLGSQVTLETARANLEVAKADVKRAELELAYIKIKAPFDGVLETRMIEQGAYIRKGDSVANFVDLDPIDITTYVPEGHISRIALGGKADVELPSGKKAAGEVFFVASTANTETRTFRVDVRIPNPDHEIAGGMTAKVSFVLSAEDAFELPLSALALNDGGIVGVKTVRTAENGARAIAAFVPVQILEEGPQSIWVDGLQDGDRVITLGHEFVTDGQEVVAVITEAAAPEMPAKDVQDHNPVEEPMTAEDVLQ
ncbi:MAG: efflux RND transporter periplasmic adaptor subunit [Pseudomonadota bacterium]|jgi:multidrug efflux system membrane fusion protein|nr:efflux RND transporter periplasmic adaptor subunit [Pseudomonadota bacterium]QKK04982.1 MAG: efflux RND transporter periplasmic adaptor subunit [Pseudomonadota bacterium]